MRFHLAPPSLLHLLTTILLAPSPILASPGPHHSALRGFSYAELFGRWECTATPCGWKDKYCCSEGTGCYTNSADIALCTPLVGSAGAGGHWTTFTRTTTMTDRETITVVSSSYVQATETCSAEKKCGSTCCDSKHYCSNGQCVPAYVGTTSTGTEPIITSGETSTITSTNTNSALPPVRQTSHSGIPLTTTQSPTTTVAYGTPVETGAQITMTSSHRSSGLSGGAIAGIVIGVLVAIFILALVCFYCCLKGIWDGLLAIFGMGRKRRVTEEVDYTKRTHYSSDGRRRNWYGAPVKTRKEERESHLGRDLLGLGAGLAGLWALLGLKRRRDEKRRVREQEKYSEYSYSSDYYTSESSASSDDRRTERYSRHSVRRSDSRRP